MKSILRKADSPFLHLKSDASINTRVFTHRHRPNEFLNLAVLKRLGPSAQEVGRVTIRQVFLDVSMINHHEGLLAIAKKKGVDTNSLEPGDFLLFINPSCNYVKILGPNMVPKDEREKRKPSHPVISMKAPSGRISSLIIAKLPEFFHGQPFDYDATLKPILEAHLAQRARERAGALKARMTKLLADETNN